MHQSHPGNYTGLFPIYNCVDDFGVVFNDDQYMIRMTLRLKKILIILMIICGVSDTIDMMLRKVESVDDNDGDENI